MNETINFVYFTTNFPRNFIKDCWKDTPHLITHLEEKLSNECTGGFIRAQGIINFFQGLSCDHQVKLANWVKKNYNYK